MATKFTFTQRNSWLRQVREYMETFGQTLTQKMAVSDFLKLDITLEEVTSTSEAILVRNAALNDRWDHTHNLPTVIKRVYESTRQQGYPTPMGSTSNTAALPSWRQYLRN